MKAQILPAVQFAFKDEQSRADKLRGLVEFGPYKDLPRAPVLGFVFPDEYRDQANRLYLSLKNGIGSFKGVETTFRFPLSKEQVFNISGFSIRGRNHSEAAKLYEDAILKWIASGKGPPPRPVFRTSPPNTAFGSRHTLLRLQGEAFNRGGILSQNATIDLIRDESRLRWSAANIALGAFVKLGGLPVDHLRGRVEPRIDRRDRKIEPSTRSSDAPDCWLCGLHRMLLRKGPLRIPYTG